MENKKNIKIITDTASDITLDLANKYNIHLIPINLTINGTEYKDKYDISTDEFYKELEKCSELPKTSQITVSQHYDTFKEFGEYSIIYCPISKNASGSASSAFMAKNMFEEENPESDITIINCETFSYCYGLWVIEAAKMAMNNATKDEIVSMIEENISKTEAIFAVDDLKYLKKGGRISSAENLVANVLDIKPILTIKDGLVVSYDKVRGTKRLYSKLVEILKSNATDDFNQSIVIYHSNSIDKAEKLKEMIAENTNFNNFIIVEIGPTIGIHTGPGALALSYIKK